MDDTLYKNVICRDDNERTTLMRRCKTEDAAWNYIYKLDRQFPNGAHDVGTDKDVAKLKRSSFTLEGER